MKRAGLGLRGKFLIALLIAAALPFLGDLIFFETIGYQKLLEERGHLHQMEATMLARAFNQASIAEGEKLRTWIVAKPSLIRFVEQKNAASANRPENEIAEETRRLDERWNTLPPTAPEIREILENPGSDTLLEYQALHHEAAEIMVTDSRGRLVAATGKTSDVDQADEEWWQKGVNIPKGKEWSDVLRFDQSSGVYSLDVVQPLYQDNRFEGVVKMSVDITTLFSMLEWNIDRNNELRQLVLPNGDILAGSEECSIPACKGVSPNTLGELRRKSEGWAVVTDCNGEKRMMGFIPLGSDPHKPNAYAVFSSRCDEVVEPLRRHFLWVGATRALILACCVIAGFHLIRAGILMPLSKLGNAARSISATAQLHRQPDVDKQAIMARHEQAEIDLKAIQSIRTGDEVEDLAEDFAVMSSRILLYQKELEAEVAAKTAVIREDLEMAREFQNALLSHQYPEPQTESFDNPLLLKFAHFYQPSPTVGGDYFDLIELDANRVGVLIADVMGHGARSALVTAIMRVLVRNKANEIKDPGVFLSEINRHMTKVISRNRNTLFVTAFFAIFDTRNSIATWSVAGHPAPLRARRKSGEVPAPLWEMPLHQPALGLFEGTEYGSTSTTLHPGDVFLLFTDGAIAGEDPQGEPFGMKRLAASFEDALDGPVAAMPAKIITDITAFQKQANHNDDVCLVVVEAAATKKQA